MSDSLFQVRESPRHPLAVYRLHGVVVSAGLHLSVLLGLLLFTARPWYFESWAAREARVLYVSTAAPNPERQEEVATRMVTEPVQVTGSMVRERVDQLADEARQRTDTENLERLDRLSERLSEVTNEGSIDRMAGALRTMLGTPSRAERPAEEAVEGDFDFDTAQFHDVRREETDVGVWRYVSVLVDAQGRVLEVEMDVEDGERIYQTMQRIKQNPLLERVYRKIAMPLFDQMLAAARQAARAAPPSVAPQ